MNKQIHKTGWIWFSLEVFNYDLWVFFVKTQLRKEKSEKGELNIKLTELSKTQISDIIERDRLLLIFNQDENPDKTNMKTTVWKSLNRSLHKIIQHTNLWLMLNQKNVRSINAVWAS